MTTNFTPREIVSELDRYIIGQHDAKRAVAIAMRNRWRRQQVAPELRDEIAPKNIIMIGPTGVGKTEIARRLAKLAGAPFIKVEASKFTEVGYVGKDVESMVRELTDRALKMVRERELEKVKVRAQDASEERILELFDSSRAAVLAARGGLEGEASDERVRKVLRRMLRKGELDEENVELPPAPPSMPNIPHIEIMSPMGFDDMGGSLKDMFSQFMPGGGADKPRSVTVAEAKSIVHDEEAAKMLDEETIKQMGVELAEQHGIIFLDEIDKIATSESSRGGADVSRAGVQRDILPIVEGSTVMTKHGMVKTDHILFIAAGAFHMAKPSDLIPELQGRFPIRVNLHPLSREDFFRILTEPKNSLQKQYEALMQTEGVALKFAQAGIDAICDVAVQINDNTEDIGARRLHTVIEKVLEEIAFVAPECSGQDFEVDDGYVQGKLADVVKDRDLSRYIL